MRKLRHGFTIRQMMVVVAVTGVLLGGWLEAARLIRVATTRRREAASHAASEALVRKFATSSSQQAQELLQSAEQWRSSNPRFAQEVKRSASIAWDQAERYNRNADYWAMLHKKYDRAARLPWSSIEPDPPPPID
jgi:hypothetical protein